MSAASQAHQRVWRWWSDPPSEEIMRDREALLKYELSLIQKAVREECEGIIAELCSIEAMKPPKTIYFDTSLITAQQAESIAEFSYERAKRELGHKLKERPR